MSVEIQSYEDSGVCVFTPIGRIDSSTAPTVQSALLPKFEDGRPIVIDLRALTYISSAGLRVLLAAAGRSKASGVELVLCDMSVDLRDIFRISGFIKIFTIYDNKRDAVGALAD